MVHTHMHSREDGTAASLPPQKAEKIWHGPSYPRNVLQLHHREHLYWLHHHLVPSPPYQVSSYPSHRLFTLLPYGKLYPSIGSRTNRHQDNFYPQPQDGLYRTLTLRTLTRLYIQAIYTLTRLYIYTQTIYTLTHTYAHTNTKTDTTQTHTHTYTLHIPTHFYTHHLLLLLFSLFCSYYYLS